MHFWGFDGAGWTMMMLFGGFMMLLFWGGVIAAVVLAVRAFAGPGGRAGASSPLAGRPLEILKERYARGEITREQYEEVKRDLDR